MMLSNKSKTSSASLKRNAFLSPTTSRTAADSDKRRRVTPQTQTSEKIPSIAGYVGVGDTHDPEEVDLSAEKRSGKEHKNITTSDLCASIYSMVDKESGECIWGTTGDTESSQGNTHPVIPYQTTANTNSILHHFNPESDGKLTINDSINIIRMIETKSGLSLEEHCRSSFAKLTDEEKSNADRYGDKPIPCILWSVIDVISHYKRNRRENFSIDDIRALTLKDIIGVPPIAKSLCKYKGDDSLFGLFGGDGGLYTCINTETPTFLRHNTAVAFAHDQGVKEWSNIILHNDWENKLTALKEEAHRRRYGSERFSVYDARHPNNLLKKVSTLRALQETVGGKKSFIFNTEKVRASIQEAPGGSLLYRKVSPNESAFIIRITGENCDARPSEGAEQRLAKIKHAVDSYSKSQHGGVSEFHWLILTDRDGAVQEHGKGVRKLQRELSELTGQTENKYQSNWSKGPNSPTISKRLGVAMWSSNQNPDGTLYNKAASKWVKVVSWDAYRQLTNEMV